MHPRDPRDLSLPSQSLDDVIKHFDALYNESPLPFCIRDQSRCIICMNDAYSDFFHPISIDFTGFSFDRDEVELELSSIELEAFIMGADTAICRNFNFNGEFYQLRVEIRCVCEELYAFWLINFFPDYQSLFQISNKEKCDDFNIDIFMCELTTKKMVTLCFFVLGFPIKVISEYLGVSESAITNRLASVKALIMEYFPSCDEFRVFCLRSDAYTRMVAVVLNVLNVNCALKK